MLKRLDHVGIAVRSLAEAAGPYEALGLVVDRAIEVPNRPLRVAFLPLGDSEVELLEPTNPESDIARFIAERGEGIHHICFEVDDIEAAMEVACRAGLRPLQPAPRQGAAGRVAFFDPQSMGGVRIELVEKA